jgi:restriction endonuclease S subunit
LSNKQIFYSVKSELENFKGVSSGTATKFLTLTILNDLKIVIANETSGKLFKKLIDPIFKQKLALEQELEMLQKLKDLILSKMTMNS